MFGMLGTLVGLALLNPISLGAGLLLGGKAISDERRAASPGARRGEDGAAPLHRRRHLPGRQGLPRHAPRVQRELRDHFTALAEELNRSLQESLDRRRAVGEGHRGRARARGSPRSPSRAEAARARLQTQARRAAAATLRADQTASARDEPPPAASALPDAVPGCCCDARSRPTGDRPARRRSWLRHQLRPARRAAAGGDRRQGQGRQVDAAQRAGRRGSSRRPTPASAPGSSPGTATAAPPRSRMHPHDGAAGAAAGHRAATARSAIDLGGTAGRRRRPAGRRLAVAQPARA